MGQIKVKKTDKKKKRRLGQMPSQGNGCQGGGFWIK